jgi:hypothetical protein
MQRTSLGGRGAPVRDSIAARRAGLEAIPWACIACTALLTAPAVAATFDPVTGTLSAKAGSLAPTTTSAAIGNKSVVSQVPFPFASGQATLNLQNPNSSRFTFEGSASSLTGGSDQVQASFNFAQRFTTTAPQWMELTARVNTDPFNNAQATAVVTLGRVGQPVALTVDYSFGEFETVAGAFAAGSFDLKGDVTTMVTSGPLDRDAQIQGNLLIAAFADFNFTGAVNSVDLATWRGGFGSTSGTFATGNLDDRAAVDGTDFLLWQRQAGAVAPALLVGSAIPEPAAFALATGVALALGWRRRRAAR